MLRSSRLPNLFALAITFVLLAAAATANAQKPALVKDVDALGRTPYQQRIFFNQDNSHCTFFTCSVTFKTVPAGYRLVVTHVSIRYKLATGGTVASVEINDGSAPGDGLLLPAPAYIGLSEYIASSPVTFYIEAGKAPTVSAMGQFVTNDGSITAEATVVGYLISLN